MKKIRKETFETNSSSTHALVISTKTNDYIPFGKNLVIKFFDSEQPLTTLQEKVSYLVSHIISWYKWNSVNYEDLIEQVQENHDFKRIEKYVKEKFGKQIVFPEKYDGDLEEIVEINHQLTSWNHALDEILEDLMTSKPDLLDEVLRDDAWIEFGRD